MKMLEVSHCRALYQLHLVKAEVAKRFIPPELRLVQAFGCVLCMWNMMSMEFQHFNTQFEKCILYYTFISRQHVVVEVGLSTLV